MSNTPSQINSSQKRNIADSKETIETPRVTPRVEPETELPYQSINRRYYYPVLRKLPRFQNLSSDVTVSPTAADANQVNKRKILYSATLKTRSDMFKRLVERKSATMTQIALNIFTFTVFFGDSPRKLHVDFNQRLIIRFGENNKDIRQKWKFQQLLKLFIDSQNQTRVTVFFEPNEQLNLVFGDVWDANQFFSLCMSVISDVLPNIRTRERPQISLNIITWNVGLLDLRQQLKLDDYDYDVKCICLQECESIKEFNPGLIAKGYCLLATKEIYWVKICVFVKEHLLPYITELDTCDYITGLGNRIGNKGTVAISFNLFATSFCFLSSHFAPHQIKVDERNENFASTINHLDIGNGVTTFIDRFDHVFWAGDFNYRIDVPYEETLAFVEQNNYDVLIQKDQLYNARKNGKAFSCFEEGEICFLPTYKRKKNLTGPAKFDDSPKKRIPAWCDRVMFRTLPATEPMTLLSYTSLEEIRSSDHVPVSALFFIPLRLYSLPSLDYENDSFWEIQIEELSVQNIRTCNITLPNVCIQFSGPFLDVNGVFKTITSVGTNAVWQKKNHEFRLVSTTTDLEYLSSHNLSAKIVHNLGKENEEFIGSCAIPLSEALVKEKSYENEKQEAKEIYRVLLNARGKQNGSLCCKIVLVRTKERPKSQTAISRRRLESRFDLTRVPEKEIDMWNESSRYDSPEINGVVKTRKLGTSKAAAEPFIENKTQEKTELKTEEKIRTSEKDEKIVGKNEKSQHNAKVTQEKTQGEKPQKAEKTVEDKSSKKSSRDKKSGKDKKNEKKKQHSKGLEETK